MMKKQHYKGPLSRRAFMKYSGAAGAALSPFVPTLNLQAQESNIPKRIIFFNTFNGTIANQFFPNDTGRDFRLKRILNPMEGFRDRMTILGNVSMDPAPGGAHTGQGMLLTNTIPNGDRQGTGISVDQFIANRIGRETPFRSVYLGNEVQGGSGGVYWRGDSDEISVEDNPYRSFDRLFGNGASSAASAQQLASRRGSVIDSVLGSLNDFKSTLPADDRILVDLHLDSLRTLETELAADIACAAPDLQQGVRDDVENMPALARINNQIAVSSLSCGLTRVVGMPFLRPVRNHALRFLGISDGLHDISHDGVPNSTEKFITIQRWYAEQLNDLLERLDAVPEGDGSMLDNTLVIWSNPLRSSHTKTNLPILMIGGQWHFDVGQYRRYSREEPHGKWLVSLCNAMGIDVDTFGERDSSRGPLGQITI